MKGGMYHSFAHKQMKHFLKNAQFSYTPTELKPSTRKEKERWGESETVKKSKLMKKTLSCEVEEWEIERVQNSLGSNVFASAQKAAQLLKRVKAIRKKNGVVAGGIDATDDESSNDSASNIESESESESEDEDDDHASILAGMDTIHGKQPGNVSPAATILEQDTDFEDLYERDEAGETREGVRKILFKIDGSDDDDVEQVMPPAAHGNYSFDDVHNSFLTVDSREVRHNQTNANLASLPRSPLAFYRTSRQIDRDDIFDPLESLQSPPLSQSRSQSPYRPSVSSSMRRGAGGRSVIDTTMELSAIAGPTDTIQHSINRSEVATKKSVGCTHLRSATMAIEPTIREEVDTIILNLQKDYVSNIQNNKFINRLFGYADNTPKRDKSKIMKNRFLSETEFFDAIRRCLSNGNLRFGDSRNKKSLNKSISNEAIWSFYQLLVEHKKPKGEKESRPVVDLWNLLRMLKTGNFLRSYDAKRITNGPLHFESKEDYQRYVVASGVYTAGKTANPQPLGGAGRSYSITKGEMLEDTHNGTVPGPRRDLHKHLHGGPDQGDAGLQGAVGESEGAMGYLSSPGVRSALGGPMPTRGGSGSESSESSNRYEQNRGRGDEAGTHLSSSLLLPSTTIVMMMIVLTEPPLSYSLYSYSPSTPPPSIILTTHYHHYHIGTKYNRSASLMTILTQQAGDSTNDGSSDGSTSTSNKSGKESNTSNSRKAKLLLGPDGSTNSDYDSLGIPLEKDMGMHITSHGHPSRQMTAVLGNEGMSDGHSSYKSTRRQAFNHHQKNEESGNNNITMNSQGGDGSTGSNGGADGGQHPNYHILKRGHGKVRTLHRDHNQCTVGQALWSGYTHKDTAGRSSQYIRASTSATDPGDNANDNMTKRFSTSQGYMRRESAEVNSSGVHQKAFAQAGGRKHYTLGTQEEESK